MRQKLSFAAATLLVLSTMAGAENTGVEIRFIANEGVMITAGNSKLMIDGFLTEPSYGRYGSLTGEKARQLEEATALFSDVDLALSSHVHLDHFQPDSAAKFLRNNSQTLFASSPQVIEALEKLGPLSSSNIKPLWSEPGQKMSLEVDGIELEAFPLSHGTGRFAQIQNLGHLIRVNGLNILHIGDAEMNPDNFKQAGIDQYKIDIALIPYWYFQDIQGMKIINHFLDGRHKIALHIPPGDLEKIKKPMSENFPSVHIFERAFEVKNFQ